MPNSRRNVPWVISLGAMIVVLSTAWFLAGKHGNHGNSIQTKAGDVSMLTIASLNFPDGGTIPTKFTCDGENISPQITFSSVPSGAKSIALIVEDPDAPAGTFIHWVLFNLPAETHELPEGAQKGTQGRNGFGKNGYGGPCPPRGKPHRYVFHAYALDSMLDLPEGATREQVDSATDGHILAEGTLTGLYGRGQ
jgi:Raf kinase inhibitor-like YbhB/YbcL family protein